MYVIVGGSGFHPRVACLVVGLAVTGPPALHDCACVVGT